MDEDSNIKWTRASEEAPEPGLICYVKGVGRSGQRTQTEACYFTAFGWFGDKRMMITHWRYKNGG